MTNHDNLLTICDVDLPFSTNRTVKAVSAVSWKFPRKNFVKAGIFRSNDR